MLHIVAESRVFHALAKCFGHRPPSNHECDIQTELVIQLSVLREKRFRIGKMRAA